jgi:hypothetical protein
MKGQGTMLVLLSAPRGRVSAARIAARARERERGEAKGDVQLPRALAVPAAPEYHPRAHPAQSKRAIVRPPLS